MNKIKCCEYGPRSITIETYRQEEGKKDIRRKRGKETYIEEEDERDRQRKRGEEGKIDREEEKEKSVVQIRR